MFNVIDLFAGAGGLSLGFQQTQKYNIKVAFENNPAMQATYRKIIQVLTFVEMFVVRIMLKSKGNTGKSTL